MGLVCMSGSVSEIDEERVLLLLCSEPLKFSQLHKRVGIPEGALRLCLKRLLSFAFITKRFGIYAITPEGITTLERNGRRVIYAPSPLTA